MKKGRSSRTFGLLSIFVVVAVVAGGAYVVRAVLHDDGGMKRKQAVYTVALVKQAPPPPPKAPDKPPEPEVRKTEEVEAVQALDAPGPVDDQTADEPPAGDTLGVDATGVAGSDSFGLVGKKGGRSLLSGGGGDGDSPMRKYAWYSQIVQEEIWSRVKKILEKNGGIPRGNLKAFVQIVVDERGRIVEHSIYKSSGNQNMDNALGEALKVVSLSKPPPEGMPRVLRVRITSQG